MEISKCSAVISGGAGGLGGATSRRLIELGMGVVIFEYSGDQAKELAGELGERAVPFEGDHNDDAAVAGAIEAAQKLGTFSVNVNAAALSVPTPATADAAGIPHGMDIWRAMIDMHLNGPFNVSRLSAAAFAANAPDDDGQRGVIINTASTAAWEGQAKQVAYSAGKSAIVGMTLAMARDLAEIGVRACAIAPGPILTPRLARASDALKAELVKNVAFPKRFGKPQEYASLVEAIIRTTFLNGQTIRLDGGLSTPFTEMTPKQDRA